MSSSPCSVVASVVPTVVYEPCSPGLVAIGEDLHHVPKEDLMRLEGPSRWTMNTSYEQAGFPKRGTGPVRSGIDGGTAITS